MTEITARPRSSNLPRPNSLLVSDLRNSVGILDTLSYSPFPTFPGSEHARDPYGLNAYLLHPADSVWFYVDPSPTEDTTGVRPASMEAERSRSLGRQKSITKHRSLSMLRRPSPLGSQPPLSIEDDIDRRAPSMRRRSSSLDSGSRPSSDDDLQEVLGDFGEDARAKTPRPLGKKSFRRAFHFTRKGFFGQSSDIGPTPPVPALPDAITITAPAIDDVEFSTPMSSRTNSAYSTVSSASSIASSEGIKTPSESLLLDIGIAGDKLAGALAEAEEKKATNKHWRGWLGGRKGSNFANRNGSERDTSLSSSSLTSSPNPSTTSLVTRSTPLLTFTPSPSIDSTPDRISSLVFPSDNSRQRTLASEQLRRASYHKMTQLRQPSPHPLALSLRRQLCDLPDEVAVSIQSGQKVFPMSVNSTQSPGSGLNPAQGGLWLSIAISCVMTKLDQRHQLPTSLMTRNERAPVIATRPKGLMDFIDRPPFKERMLVYYADGVFSPISMARPGYGVWDLDFSRYTVALSEVDDPVHSWPAIPRASMEENIGDLGDLTLAAQDSNDNLAEEVFARPENRDETPSVSGLEPIFDAVPSAEDDSKSTLPLLSFRNARREIKTWDSSSEDVSEDESDEEPLAKVVKETHLRHHRVDSKISTPISISSNHTRSRSQPNDVRTYKAFPPKAEEKWKQVRQMEEVAKARERREAARSGGTERRAMADQRRPEATKRANEMWQRSSVLNMHHSSASRIQPHRFATHRTSASVSSGPQLPSPHVATASPRRRT